jgi:hypothetical protein
MERKNKKEHKEAEDTEVEQISREKQRKAQNKILRNMLIGILILLAGVVLIIFASKSLSHFEYRGVKFDIVRFCDAGPPCLILYRTTMPVKTEKNTTVIVNQSEKNADYSFYFRNDPRKSTVDFNGTIKFGDNMVFNSEADFSCNGYGAIAGANFNQLFKVLETKVIRDENATCDPSGRYVFVDVKPGNETRVEQFGPACYNIYVKDCEVLEGTEKFMIEALVKVDKTVNI